jgi:hypothetical protein
MANKYDGKPIRYPRGHVSNVFSSTRWHNEAPYSGYGPNPGRALSDDEIYAAHNEANARERERFQAEARRQREAEEEKARKAREHQEWLASPEGQSALDSEWRKAFGGKDRTK